MPVRVNIPAMLRHLSGGVATVEVEGVTVGEALDKLVEQCPDLESRLRDDKGEMKKFVNVFHGNEDIRFLDGLATKIDDGQEISIISAVAGG